MVVKRSLLKSFENLVIEKKDTPPLKVLVVGAECSPFASAGGFASAVASLSKELLRTGVDVRVFLPRYGSIDEEKYAISYVHKDLQVPTGDEEAPYLICNVKQSVNPVTGVRTYFLENEEYYEKRANIYGYSDDPTRWALLSRGALEFVKTKIFVPDVIHTNDWHTGIVANYVETAYRNDPLFETIATLFTIHNLSIQGMFLDPFDSSALDFDDGRSEIASFFSPRLNKQNFMRRGILYSDIVNTVSKKYAREVLTPEHGNGLDTLLLELKEKFFGIINGINYDELNPKTDRLIEKNYDIHSIENRSINKRSLQKEFDLEISEDVPLFAFVGRLDNQKGIDLIVNTLQHALKDLNIQFISVGGGDNYLAGLLLDLKKDFPSKVGVHPYFNSTLPRLVFAGSDSILYPSRFEPCGIVQLEAMRYGCIPIVRDVGGLSDTVVNFDSKTKTGTGFVFSDFSEFSLYGQIVRAYELLQHPTIWKTLVKNAMSTDFSWQRSAREYIRLYDISKTFKEKKGQYLH